MNYKYAWARGSHHKANPQLAGEVCAKLESEGGLTPTRLVDASRPEDAPLHDEFEWDDTVAAERYRETQASQVIRHITTVKVNDEETPVVRSFVSIQTRDDDDERIKNTYIGTYRALSEPDTREMVLNRAMSELGSFRRKYATLKELSGVIAAIDEAIGKAEAA